MTEYNYIVEDGEVRTCECCRTEAPLRVFRIQDAEFDHLKGDRRMCALCANSLAGNTLSYPSHYPQAQVIQHINFVANRILDVITSRKPD